MQVRPYSERRDADLIFEIALVKYEEDSQGSVVCIDDAPVFDWGEEMGYFEGGYPSTPRGAFTRRFKRKDALTPAASWVFDHMVDMLPYGTLEPFYDDATKRPILNKKGNRCLAKVTARGNVTKTFTYDDMSTRTRLTKQTVKDAIQLLEDQGIVVRRAVDKSTETKMVRKGGRPKDFLRYEISSEYAWNGRLDHGLTCAQLPPTVGTPQEIKLAYEQRIRARNAGRKHEDDEGPTEQ